MQLPLRHSGPTASSVDATIDGDMSNVTLDVVPSVVMSEDGKSLKEIGKKAGKKVGKKVGKEVGKEVGEG